MKVLKFVDNINSLLNHSGMYFETENEIRFDCRINKQFGFDKELLKQLKILGILITDEKNYTKVQRFKGKTFRCMIVDKRKFRSLEKLVSLRN